MINISASEAKNRLGSYIEAALVEPILIERSGRPAVILLSVKEYERLKQHEQSAWRTLDEGYQAMAADDAREQDARDWLNGLSGDLAHETR